MRNIRMFFLLQGAFWKVISVSIGDVSLGPAISGLVAGRGDREKKKSKSTNPATDSRDERSRNRRSKARMVE